ncbi:2353_t:CDS:2 [Gigaspora margarita]|uniref:2353_t:CDS:1 n=1 Tax=Gigaspora margarita TaxID=4874 RepID=A0ABN7UAR4_GIGMA|nr:2353_t:CDS:2 [Gigaspora margarita]
MHNLANQIATLIQQMQVAPPLQEGIMLFVTKSPPEMSGLSDNIHIDIY